MLEYLDAIDRTLFLFINLKMANPVTDLIMPWVTSGMFLRVMYGLAMGMLLWRGHARLRWLVLFSIVTLVLTDQTSSSLLKKMIERPRPCQILAEINLLVGCGGGFAMPSSHAANAFGQAFLFSLCVTETRYYLYAFAALVALSRVFVGVHYPGDILAGALLGAVVGLSLAVAFGMLERAFLLPGLGDCDARQGQKPQRS